MVSFDSVERTCNGAPQSATFPGADLAQNISPVRCPFAISPDVISQACQQPSLIVLRGSSKFSLGDLLWQHPGAGRCGLCWAVDFPKSTTAGYHFESHIVSSRTAIAACACAIQVVARPKSRMTSATIKLFLPSGDAKSLRTAEISNWTGKAIAAPRTEFDELLKREELDKSGIYILLGTDPTLAIHTRTLGKARLSVTVSRSINRRSFGFPQSYL